MNEKEVLFRRFRDLNPLKLHTKLCCLAFPSCKLGLSVLHWIRPILSEEICLERRGSWAEHCGQPPPGAAGQHRLSSAGVETTLNFAGVQLVTSWCDAAAVSLLGIGASSRHEFGSIKIARSCPLETAPLVSRPSSF